jgi:hypothetical protein
MRSMLPFKFILLPAAFICTCKTFAQDNTPDSTHLVAKENAISLYHRLVYPETNLYNGIEYVDYAYTLNEGSPYFITSGFVNGAVTYNGISYTGVPILYDGVKEEVVIPDPSGKNKIRLHTEKVSGFDLSNLHFTKLTADSLNRSVIRTGFYEVLYNGKISLYKKQTKKILENITISQGLRRTIDEQSGYFIRKNNHYFTVNDKRSLLNSLKDEKKEIQQFMKKNKLKMRKEKELSLIRIAAYYDEITKSK